MDGVARVIGLWRAGADLLVGARCAGCGQAPGLLCSGCRPALTADAWETVPDPCPPGLPPVRAVAAYTGVARAVLVAHKEDGRLALARPLGEALARSVAGALTSMTTAAPPITTADAVALVPVPSRPGSSRRRGHDPLLRMARHAAAVLRSGAPGRLSPVGSVTVMGALRHTRRVVDQAGLGVAERQANLRGALAVRRGAEGLLAGCRIVIVDDVVTTGSTLAEAARALRSAGHPEPAAAVVAATSRRRPGRSGPSETGTRTTVQVFPRSGTD